MTIDPTLLLSSTQQPTTTSAPKSILGKDDFLKLLVTQLKAQDPLNPMKSDQFVSQMAQFTSLEQTQNMSDAITQFVNSQTSLGSQASMIGKTITWTSSSGATTGLTTASTSQIGVVTAVSQKNGAISYVVNGTSVDPSEITSIQETPNAQPVTSTSAPAAPVTVSGQSSSSSTGTTLSATQGGSSV